VGVYFVPLGGPFDRNAECGPGPEVSAVLFPPFPPYPQTEILRSPSQFKLRMAWPFTFPPANGVSKFDPPSYGTSLPSTDPFQGLPPPMDLDLRVEVLFRRKRKGLLFSCRRIRAVTFSQIPFFSRCPTFLRTSFSGLGLSRSDRRVLLPRVRCPLYSSRPAVGTLFFLCPGMVIALSRLSLPTLFLAILRERRQQSSPALDTLAGGVFFFRLSRSIPTFLEVSSALVRPGPPGRLVATKDDRAMRFLFGWG